MATERRLTGTLTGSDHRQERHLGIDPLLPWRSDLSVAAAVLEPKVKREAGDSHAGLSTENRLARKIDTASAATCHRQRAQCIAESIRGNDTSRP